MKLKYPEMGWKTIMGVVATAISGLVTYFDIIPKDIGVIAGSLSAVLAGVGIRAAIGKLIIAAAEVVNEIKKEKK